MNPRSLRGKLARLLARHPVRREDLSAYLDARLGATDRERLEEHLAACDRCRQELEELRAVVRALGDLPHEPAPRSFRLSAAQVEAARPAARPTWAYGALGTAGAAAAILFAVLLGGDLLTTDGMEEAMAPDGGYPQALIGRQAQEAAEADEGLPSEPGLMAEEAPRPEPTVEATPPVPSPPAIGAPAEAYAPPVPTQPPEAAEAEEPAAVQEEDEGAGRLALRVGEAAAAAVALAALGGLLILWRRGTRT
jgi:hypothetical protein